MTEAVVFDMDGVIFDSEALVIRTWKIVAKKYGFSDVEQVCRKCLGTNAAATRRIFLDFYGNLLDVATRASIFQMQSELPFFRLFGYRESV